MTNLVSGFHLFGTSKIFARSLVIYQCQFKNGADQTKIVSIKRTYRELDGSYRHEDTDVDYAIFSKGGTLHLHDLFLTSLFGITVTFGDGKGQIETLDLKSDIQSNPLLEFLSLNKEELILLNHAEVSPAR